MSGKSLPTLGTRLNSGLRKRVGDEYKDDRRSHPVEYLKAATGARFASPTEKEEGLRLADEARRIYAGL